MPELPEVETIVRALRDGGRGGPSILKKQVGSADLFWERTLAEPEHVLFDARMPGQIVQNISRRGKFIVISLSQDVLLVHLRMSGDLRVKSGGEILPHDRLAVNFTGSRLVFNDARKFGRVWLVEDQNRITGELGPEPFDPNLTSEVFHQRLNIHRRQIKPLLLDQKFIAGVGNITAMRPCIWQIHPMQNSADKVFNQADNLLMIRARRAFRRNSQSWCQH